MHRARLAVIPARGGSKRIPRKNIRPFLGVPMLVRTIGLLSSAGVFDRIVVSTDDDEIASIASSAGAEVPFRRPVDLADDVTPTVAVIQHAITAMAAEGSLANLVCCVYPAAVLASAHDIAAALQMIETSGADYAFPVAEYPYPIQRALRRTADGRCQMMWPANQLARSQDLEPVYHDVGQFYWGRVDAWLDGRPIFSEFSRLLIIPHYRVQDIDTPEDWERAELIYEHIHRQR